MNPLNQPPHERKLSDADIEAIVNQGEKVILARFYRNLGMGVWGLVWRAVVVGLVALAAYGAMTGRH